MYASAMRIVFACLFALNAVLICPAQELSQPDDFQTLSAQRAKKRFEKSIEDAGKVYVRDLEEAKREAEKKTDVGEVQRIARELETMTRLTEPPSQLARLIAGTKWKNTSTNRTYGFEANGRATTSWGMQGRWRVAAPYTIVVEEIKKQDNYWRITVDPSLEFAVGVSRSEAFLLQKISDNQ